MFVKKVLGESPYDKQEEILKAVAGHRRVSVVGCNGSGKDWAAARAVLWWMYSRSPAKAIVTGPTSRQVDDIVWNEIRSAYGRASDVLAGRMFRTARYQLDEQSFALGFATNSPKEFLAESKDYDIVLGQLTPIENLDYDANTNQDSSGTDISSELTVTHPNTTDFSGKGTLIRVAFGVTAGYLTLLKLRTLNAFTYDAPVLLLAEDTTSKNTYGERIRTIEARWTREVDVALATIQSRRDRKKDPKTVLRVVVPNGSKANMMLILQRGFSDRVTVQYSAMGINEAFFIEGHRTTVGEGWSSVTGELLLQGVQEKMEIDLTPFLNAGIPGVLLVWFMFRLERILSRFDKTVQLVARAVIRLLERADPEEASALSKALHRVNGGDE